MSITAKKPNPMKELYRRLQAAGLPRKYVRTALLPSWWVDEIAVNPAGYAEAVMLLSRHSGIDVRALLADKDRLRLSDTARARLKKSRRAAGDDLMIARGLATQVASYAAMGADAIPLRVPTSARGLRQDILDEGNVWVSLDNLLDACWARGIPVVHMSAFPQGVKRMEGLAAKIRGRPVVVIAKDQKTSAWLLFILAHELGHIALGHLGDDQVLAEADIGKAGADADAEEKAANAFAMELLSGDPELRVVPPSRWPAAEELARAAKRLGIEHRIDPGHVVLNYAHSMGPTFFAVANAALNQLEPAADAPQRIRERLARRLAWSNLPREASEFLMRMTQTDVAVAS